MPEIIFIEPGGATRHVSAALGQTLLQAAQEANIAGILGDCGGNCACATCNVYPEGAAATALPAPAEDETAMLEGALYPRPESRLACQITLTEALSGLVVRTPPAQI